MGPCLLTVCWGGARSLELCLTEGPCRPQGVYDPAASPGPYQGGCERGPRLLAAPGSGPGSAGCAPLGPAQRCVWAPPRAAVRLWARLCRLQRWGWARPGLRGGDTERRGALNGGRAGLKRGRGVRGLVKGARRCRVLKGQREGTGFLKGAGPWGGLKRGTSTGFLKGHRWQRDSGDRGA